MGAQLQLLRLGDELEAVHLRHVVVGAENLEPLVGQKAKGAGRRRAGHDIDVARQHGFDSLECVPIVVDDEHAIPLFAGQCHRTGPMDRSCETTPLHSGRRAKWSRPES
jgi:hypothetical protein